MQQTIPTSSMPWASRRRNCGGRNLQAQGALRGVMTHAGESYTVRGAGAHARFAELEGSGTVKTAETLRCAALDYPAVSVGQRQRFLPLFANSRWTAVQLDHEVSSSQSLLRPRVLWLSRFWAGASFYQTDHAADVGFEGFSLCGSNVSRDRNRAYDPQRTLRLKRHLPIHPVRGRRRISVSGDARSSTMRDLCDRVLFATNKTAIWAAVMT